MLRYFKSHLLLVIISILTSILTCLLVPITAIVERQMIDYITASNFNNFQRFLFVAGGVALIAIFLYFIDAFFQKKFQVRFEEKFRNDLYDGVMSQSIVDFNEKDTSKQMSYIKSYASTIANNLCSPIFILIGYGLMGVIILIMLFYYSPIIALVSIACAGFSTILPLFFNKKLKVNLMKKLKSDAEMTFQLKEALNAHETVASFGTFSCIQNRFFKASRNMADADYKTQISISLVQNVAKIAQKITWFFAFLAVGNMAAQAKITLGTMIMLITLFSEFNSCVTLFAQTVPILLSTRPEIKEALKIVNRNTSPKLNGQPATFEKTISIKDLFFRYIDEIPVIEDCNLTIYKNEKIALTGISGSGKTTLIKLLSGYYNSYTGEISYDNQELHEINLQTLRSVVTVIHQNMFIFNDTIRFNICMGEPFTDVELQNALHLSGVDRFLADIAGGIDGVCGENGSLLSGGQRQRIALARALIRGIHFLIIDEGVSAVDVETANEIEQELLRNKDLTLLTITHRIKDGIISQYDRMLSIKEGKLFENSQL